MININLKKTDAESVSGNIQIFSKSRIKIGIINASYLTLGNIFSQIIGLIGFFYIARVLGPDNYGIYATVMAFVGFFSLFTFTGLARVIIREGSKKLQYLHRLLEKTVGIRLYAIIFAILSCCISSIFTGYSNYIKFLIIIFSFELVEIGLRSFLGTIYQATENMKYIAYFSVLSRMVFVALAIGFLYHGFGVLAIILINLISRFSILIINYIISRRYVRFNISFNLHLEKEIIKPAVIFSLIGFINTLATKIDILMISFLSTAQDVGIYAIAFRISREGSMLRNLITVAFFPIVVKYFMDKKLKGKDLIKYSSLFLVASLCCCFALSFFVQDLVILIFGNNYAESGYILKYLLYYLIFSFYSIPYSLSLQATHNEKITLIVAVVIAFLNIPLNVILFYQFGLIGIAYSTLIVYATGNMLLSLLTYKKLKLQGHII